MAVSVASAGNAAVPITSCGDTVPAGQRGVLQNDVDCEYRCSEDRSIVCGFGGDDLCVGKGACDPESLAVERDAVLDLNGHAVHAAFGAYSVVCVGDVPGDGRCVVKGPGRVNGEIVSWGPDVLIRGVDLLALYHAVYSKGHVVIRRSNLMPNSANDVYGEMGIKMVDVKSNADEIESAGDIELRRVELGPERTYVTSPATVVGCDVVMMGVTWIEGRNVKLRRATTVASDVHVTGSNAAAQRRLRLVDSSVQFIVSGEEPKLVRSTCETSHVAGASSSSWGVCAND